MKQTSVVVIVAVVIIIIAAIYFFMMPHSSNNQPAANTSGNTQSQDTSATPSDSTNTIAGTATDFTIQGMQVQVVTPGTGAAAKDGDMVTVDYTGTLQNGTAFDSNTDPKFGHVTPFQFTLGAGQVIQGWDLGVAGMKVGEERKLTIPANLAYGSQSPSPTIPPNSTLIFDVKLLKIN